MEKVLSSVMLRPSWPLTYVPVTGGPAIDWPVIDGPVTDGPFIGKPDIDVLVSKTPPTVVMLSFRMAMFDTFGETYSFLGILQITSGVQDCLKASMLALEGN